MIKPPNRIYSFTNKEGNNSEFNVNQLTINLIFAKKIMQELYSNIPILFGFIAAFIHVVSGPDHIAAVGPLAINTRFRPWLIGMSWGIGHLAGMMIIGLLFYFFREIIPVDWISAHSERLVGIMLIIIGLWGVGRLFISRFKKHEHVHKHSDYNKAYVHKHGHDHSHQHLLEHAHPRSHTHEHPQGHTDIQGERQTYIAALGIGILHGLAGVSHFISILPTITFSSNFDSAMYLTGFGLGTISAMVIFSVLLGILGKKTVKLKEKIVFNTISATIGFMAIFVGVIWIWNTW
ncbi:MAG: hypothetical protein GXO88_12740 [Chlorobi bacterium]|nr:hypothetical protein [Chlorobiota bacterium]